MSTDRMPEFRAEATRVGPAATLALHGELDMMVAPQVDEGVERLIALAPESLTIDLRGLSFMDSSGIHALIVAERKCRKHGVQFMVIRGRPAIDRLLALCGLDERFEIVGEPTDVAVDTPAL